MILLLGLFAGLSLSHLWTTSRVLLIERFTRGDIALRTSSFFAKRPWHRPSAYGRLRRLFGSGLLDLLEDRHNLYEDLGIPHSKAHSGL